MNRQVIFAMAGAVCVVIAILFLIDYIDQVQRAPDFKRINEDMKAGWDEMKDQPDAIKSIN